MGNIVNRVFDSSGPEGKVRGTPQQIIDKYNQLARDAQLANDRVATENFQQHAEHYTRMLSEALREQNERREQQEREQEARRSNNQRDDNRGQQNENRGQQPSGDAQDGGDGGRGREPASAGDEVIDTTSGDQDSTLVETPEDKPQRQRRPRKPRKSEAGAEASPSSDQPDAPEAAE
jgi:hypothetical protein